MFEAYQTGPFLLRSYVLILSIGMWLGLELLIKLASDDNLRISLLLKKWPLLILSFILGGRVLALILLYRVYVQDPLQIFILWDGAFNVVGGWIGVGILLFLLTRKRDASLFLLWLDSLIIVVSLVLAFDWLGRYLGAMSYGKPTDVLWGVTYDSMIVRYTVPIHPVQLYYAAWFFLMTIALLYLRKESKKGSRSFRTLQRTVDLHQGNAGVITLVGIVSACLGVLLLEFYRGDFAVSVFAKLSDFIFLAFLFSSLGVIAILENRISQKYSLINSIVVGGATILYLFVRSWITVASVEWRLSQFLAVLAMLGTVVYVVIQRWKYRHT